MKTHLVIHHSLTEDSGTVSWGAIRRYHVEDLGWREIGYHFGVELIGDEYEMLVGRPLLATAAAAYQEGMNRKGVHVCFIGNYDKREPDEYMLRYAAPHLADICYALGIPIDSSHVIGHNEVARYKTCPGGLFSVRRLIELMRGAY